ncbi:MAG: hypothetical protein U9Q66_01525 [Patescibacteria group bacterium]|nr:hypothetical protein [Patescibacteria group bacterium]
MSQALYVRICAFASLSETEKVISEMTYLIQLSPDYKDIILDSEYLINILSNKRIEEVLN